jgi:hypothetical protein
MLSALKRQKNSIQYIDVFAAGGLLSALLFLWEVFCPPSHFHRRALVRPVISTGGLLSALSFFGREGFCLGWLLSYTQTIIRIRQSLKASSLTEIIEHFNLNPSAATDFMFSIQFELRIFARTIYSTQPHTIYGHFVF